MLVKIEHYHDLQQKYKFGNISQQIYFSTLRILIYNSDFIASVSNILNVCFQLSKLLVKNIKEQSLTY